MKDGFYRHVPFEVYAEQERRAREQIVQHTNELLKTIRFVDPTAKITFVQDEIIIECSEKTTDRITQLLRGGL